MMFFENDSPDRHKNQKAQQAISKGAQERIRQVKTAVISPGTTDPSTKTE